VSGWLGGRRRRSLVSLSVWLKGKKPWLSPTGRKITEEKGAKFIRRKKWQRDESREEQAGMREEKVSAEEG